MAAIDFPNTPTIGDLFTAAGKTWQWNGTFWDMVSTQGDMDRLRLSATNDANLASTLHALQIGPDSDLNLIIDNNEIMARNNGAASTLALQGDGGRLNINDRPAAIEQHGSYTPALTNVTLGTGGSSSGEYTFVGGPLVGDHGILSVDGIIALGTSGMAMGTGPTMALPAGFQRASGLGTNILHMGQWRAIGLTQAFWGTISWATPTSVIPTVMNTATGTYGFLSGISASIPEAWGAFDSLVYTYTTRVVRV